MSFYFFYFVLRTEWTSSCAHIEVDKTKKILKTFACKKSARMEVATTSFEIPNDSANLTNWTEIYGAHIASVRILNCIFAWKQHVEWVQKCRTNVCAFNISIACLWLHLFPFLDVYVILWMHTSTSHKWMRNSVFKTEKERKSQKPRMWMKKSSVCKQM